MQDIKFTDGRTVQLDAPDLQTALRRMASINSMTLRAIDLKGRDLSGLDLSGIAFDGCSLDGADFTKSDLSGARFNGALKDTVMRKATLVGADFRGAELRGVDLTGATLDLADFRNSVVEDVDFTKAVWRTEALDAAQSTRFDVAAGPRGVRKHEAGGSLPFGADPFEGASVTGAKLDRDALPETHSTLRSSARTASIGGFVAGMAASKPAKVVGLGGAAVLWGTFQSAADGRLGELARSPVAGSGLDVVAYLKTTAATVGGWAEAAMNTMVPGTAESAGMLTRLSELGLGQHGSLAMMGVAAVGVMAGAALIDKLKPGEKITAFAKEKCSALARAVGYDGDLRRYVANRARLLFSEDRKALSSFRSLMDAAEDAAGHRLMASGGGYFMVCDRDEFSMAVAAMRDHSRLEWSDPSMRATTFWFEASVTDPAIPASLTFLPTAGEGVEVLATWRDASGAFAGARLHDRFGEPTMEIGADGTRTVAFAPGLELRHLFGAVEGRFEADRFARLPAEVRSAFEYDPATHGLSRAHDGTWTLRERATGKLDDGTGALAVYRPAAPDSPAMALSYRSGRLEGWAEDPTPSGPQNG